MEIWKDIKGYEGLYQVSNLGRVRRMRFINNVTNKEKITYIKPHIQNQGYLIVMIYKNGKYKNRSVHRLVAETFIENPFNLPEVNHKDGNKSNNTVDNLEWCSRGYNMREAARLGLWKAPCLNKFGSNNPKAKPVVMKDINTNETIRIFYSLRDAADYCNSKSSGSIVDCCRGRRKQASGYKWEYLEDEK